MSAENVDNSHPPSYNSNRTSPSNNLSSDNQDISAMNKSDNPCTLTLCHGTHFDLNPLSSASGDYEAKVGDSSYKLNVCRSVVSELWNLDEPENVGGFVNRTGGDFSIGRPNTTLHISPQTDEPMLYLDNGSPCPGNPEERASSVIRFVCSPSDFNAGTPQLIAAIPPLDTKQSCHFVFEWKTHVACPTNPRAELERGHYIAFGAILAIAIITWFAGHTLYNRFYLSRRGLDQFPLPRLSMPSIKLPSFKKGGEASRPKWGFGRRSQRGGGYTAMNQDETQGFAARYSLSDDESEAEDLTGGAEDARVLGGEAREWRGQARRSEEQSEGRVGVHQGLVDV